MPLGSALTDDVLPFLDAWIKAGKRCALATLIGLDGPSPRPLGAQMAICRDGAYAGYLSGGCLEKAIALEAVEVINTGQSRLLRYGQGSPFFDIRLPCGSGLDVFIQPIGNGEVIEAACKAHAQRQIFAFDLHLKSGALSLETKPELQVSRLLQADLFRRIYTPSLRCLIVGGTPIAICLAEAAHTAGFEVELHMANIESYPVPPGIQTAALTPSSRLQSDAWTAVILAFHDHDQEIPLFKKLLPQDSFVIAAIGSQTAHKARCMALAAEGISGTLIKRIHSPAGVISGLKSAPHVAISVLAQVIEVARSKGVIAA